MIGAWRYPRFSVHVAAVLTALAIRAPFVLAQAAKEVSSAEKDEFFTSRVRPLLEAECLSCHGAKGKPKGGLYLTGRDGVLRGGDLGPAATLDDPAASLLLRAISYANDELQMPPRAKLSDEDQATLRRWIELGVPFPGGEELPVEAVAEEKPLVTDEARRFWSYQPVTRPVPPRVVRDEWVRTPVDSFLLSRLEKAGLVPPPPADPLEALRRMSYSVTGLPPSEEEQAEFLRTGDWDAAVERALASPHYGEHWARHWLDVVRFAETHSFERDNPKPNAWRYRDWVIDSLNEDKPYDQFVIEQLAGDELDRVTPETIVATGYYRLGIWDDEPTDRKQAIYDELDDIVATTGQAFLGITINCARCHDHKIDPMPQRDYYRLLAFFHGIRSTQQGGNDAILTSIDGEEFAEALRRNEAALEREKREVAAQLVSLEEILLEKLSDDDREAAKSPRDRRRIVRDNLSALCKEEKARWDELEEQLARLRRQRPDKGAQALCVKETGPVAPETFVLVRGSAHAPGDRVEPGYPEVLGFAPPTLPTPKEGATTSGRRRVLAEWIASADNPLTARVIANRVWQHHFGRGIVRSPNDFGFQGDRPTHPELLDWLASELVENGWSLKQLHRAILRSSAFRMSSRAYAKGLESDPTNDLFWRFDMRRLQAEEIRDSILAVNGTLNTEMGGPGIYTIIPQAVLAGQSRPGSGWGSTPDAERARRSVYIHVKRSLLTPFLQSFDLADTDASCPVRFTTTQPTQALTMLNSDFMERESTRFAERVITEAADDRGRVRRALQLVTCREPTETEVDRGVEFMDALQREHGASAETALRQFCLLALNLNEFVYID